VPRRLRSLTTVLAVTGILAATVILAAPAPPTAAATPCDGWTTTTVASGLGRLENLEPDGEGGMFVSDIQGNAIKRVTRDGTTTTLASVPSPGGLRVRDNVLYANSGNSAASGVTGTADGTLERFDLGTGKRTTWATGLIMPNGLVRDAQGNAYASRDLGSDGKITKIPAADPVHPIGDWANIADTNGLAIDPTGQWLYASTTFNAPASVYRIKLSDPTVIQEIAQLSSVGSPVPKGLDDLTIDAAGILYITANASGEVFRLDPKTGAACVLASGFLNTSAVKFGSGPGWPDNHLFVSSWDGKVTELSPPAPAAGYTPTAECNVAIKMSDGINLRANIRRPSEPGRYPTVLTVTGYNKDAGLIAGTCDTNGAGLVEKGYSVIMLDDRGTGNSDGKWMSWDARTQADYGEVLDWIQAQPWSDGMVGATGGSYMGITSFMVTEKDAERVAAGKPRAVYAVWADVPMADAYRDVVAHGGNVDAGFMPFWLGLTHALSILPPQSLGSDPAGAVKTWADHITDIQEFAGTEVTQFLTGGEAAYDGPFFRVRSPGDRAHTITVPVAWTGGWFDIFQRAEPMYFELLRNAPVKKWWQMAIYHGAADPTAWDKQGIGTLDAVKLRWWNRWLKGERNGVESLPDVNLWNMGTNQWSTSKTWPLPGTDYTRYYFGDGTSGSAQSLNDGVLAAKPSTSSGEDSMPFLPVGGICNRSSVQWTAGLGGKGTPCETDNSYAEMAGLTYTTEPLAKDTEITGYITAEFWAKLTRPDATFVVTVSDVDPSGKSSQITAGWLNASHRAIDEARTLRAPKDKAMVIRPFHPFTQQAQQSIESGKTERYLVEVLPTSNVFVKGHRIRVAITSADEPHMVVPAPALANMVGGQVTILRGAQHPSNVVLPLQQAHSGQGKVLAKGARISVLPVTGSGLGLWALVLTAAALLSRRLVRGRA